MVVFAVLGIFSGTHREFAKEAFDCVFRKMTLRKCQTSFDKKMKMKITTKVAGKSDRLGRMVYRNFEIFSWFFTLILILSMAYSAYSVYNLAVYGTCDLQNPDECVFNPNAPAETITAGCSEQCNAPLQNCSEQIIHDCNADCGCLKEVCSTPLGTQT